MLSVNIIHYLFFDVNTFNEFSMPIKTASFIFLDLIPIDLMRMLHFALSPAKAGALPEGEPIVRS